ncbi:MAG: hypothetical protein NT069_32625 [Planctomycetota bacterium]|nr:hypothetical protein [Planctomycetota bacterium]
MQFDPIGFARFGCERDAAVQSLCVRKIGQQLASRITDLQHAVEASAESTGHEINGNESTRIGDKFVPVHLGQPAQAAGNGDGQRGEPLWQVARPCFHDLLSATHIKHRRLRRTVRAGHLPANKSCRHRRIDVKPPRDLASNGHRAHSRARAEPIGWRRQLIFAQWSLSLQPHSFVMHKPLHVWREVEASQLNIRDGSGANRGRKDVAKLWRLLREHCVNGEQRHDNGNRPGSDDTEDRQDRSKLHGDSP